jgi:hypothetical protein
VKRRGKSPPLQAQARRHGKPHRVQGQIGDPETARFGSALRNGFRVLAAETNDSLPGVLPGRQNSAYSPSKTATPRKDEFPESPFKPHREICEIREKVKNRLFAYFACFAGYPFSICVQEPLACSHFHTDRLR